MGPGCGNGRVAASQDPGARPSITPVCARPPAPGPARTTGTAPVLVNYAPSEPGHLAPRLDPGDYPMRIRVFALVIACAAATMSLAARADGDPAKGKVDAYTCIGCHGVPNYTNVYPTYRVPQLAGQHAAYIVQALKEYKSGERNHKTMHAQASSLSDQQMQDIAAYFESLGSKTPADPRSEERRVGKECRS